MKLNLGNKNEMSIQEKVKSVLALNNDGNLIEKENNKMKLNLKKSTNDSPVKLNLNSKSTMERESELTLQKFAVVDELKTTINEMSKAFDSFLIADIEKNSFLNGMDKKIDNLEILVLNSIKNQKSILDGINNFHAKTFQVTKEMETITETKPPETKLIKAIDKLSIDNPNSVYKFFMNSFDGNFIGTKELTNLKAFADMIESIDFESTDTIDTSFKKYFSEYLKSNDNKQPIARKRQRHQ